MRILSTPACPSGWPPPAGAWAGVRALTFLRCSLITQLQPDVYAKGGDYTPEMLAETDAVEEYGGRVAILDYVAERSTTAVVQRIRDAAGAEPLSEAADLG